jgi:hypothetical protein
MKIRRFEKLVEREARLAINRAKKKVSQKKEDAEQQDFVIWARAIFNLVWHTPNAREKKTARLYWHSMGVLAGVPDICIVHRGVNIALEFKSAGGKLSPDQKRIMRTLHENGWHVAVVYSAEEAKDFVRSVLGMEKEE